MVLEPARKVVTSSEMPTLYKVISAEFIKSIVGEREESYIDQVSRMLQYICTLSNVYMW